MRVPALTKAVEREPDNDSYVYVLGSAKVAKGQLPDALALFQRLLKKHPDDAILTYATGAVYYLQGKYSEAEASLKREPCCSAESGSRFLLSGSNVRCNWR